MTDRARPSLVALYDIRPGNGAGQFLQPRSPHGANGAKDDRGVGNNWSYKMCKAPVKSSPTTNQNQTFRGHMSFMSPNQELEG